MPVGPRPYSRLRSNKLPSVTTVLDELSKPGLRWGAAIETAKYAVHHQSEWAHLDPALAVTKIYRHHEGIWLSRAAVGTLCHTVLESWAQGKEVGLATLVDKMMAETKDCRLWWDEPYDQVMERILGYVNGLEAFWSEHIVVPGHNLKSEIIVRYPGKYIGTADLVFGDTLLDLKTTHQQGGKGFYADSYSLQLHAYAYAQECVYYGEKDGKIVETGTSEWRQPSRLAVLHLRGDTRYTLWEFQKNQETFDRFMGLLDLYTWRKNLPKAELITGGVL